MATLANLATQFETVAGYNDALAEAIRNRVGPQIKQMTMRQIVAFLKSPQGASMRQWIMSLAEPLRDLGVTVEIPDDA